MPLSGMQIETTQHKKREHTMLSNNVFQYVQECNDHLLGSFIARSGGFIDHYKPIISYLDGVVITKYTGNAADVTIPSVLDGRRVVGIGANAFAKQQQLRSVYMEEGLVRIGVDAFLECGNLQFVHFPESLELIDGGAFCDTALAELSLPAKLRKIGQLAFSDSLSSSVHVMIVMFMEI